jgi:CMP-N-acetylneuraminic acid synthetase/3-deoxy-D-manno-octulosonate 8-phosphate phosphatase KdsC-like HAD superfamily phosphatase
MDKLKLIVFDFDGVFTNCNLKFRDVNCRDTFGLTYLTKYDVGICTRSDGKHIPQIILDRVKFVIKNCTSKYKKIMELGYQEDEIAYMGDDTHDLECIKKFKYSACPKDAHPKVLEYAKFISNFNGGRGAVREYCDYLVSHHGKITAIIPVRSGSTRCKNKNIRKFGDSNLLKLKIDTLKKVKNIEKIMVSSNDDDMLEIARSAGAIPVKRPEKYCTNLCSGSDMYCALAEAVDTDIMLYTHCVCPFISAETYEKMIDIWVNNRDCDSIMTAHELHEYLWYNNKPLNYEYDNAPPSQTIKGYYIPTFGSCIVHKEFVLKNRNIIGFKPYFYPVDQLEALDIDTPFEFYTAELLYKNKIKYLRDVNQKLNIRDTNIRNRSNILYLDCTIRDGGYLNNWEFSDDEVLELYKIVTNAPFHYFEIGFKTNRDKLKGKGKWCYCDEADISKIVNQYRGCKIAVMAKLGTVTLDDFTEAKNSVIDMVRVLVPHNNEDRESLINEKLANDCEEMCRGLVEKGYEITLNFACFNHVTNEELDLIINKVIDLPIKCVYIADTYGNMKESDVIDQIDRLKKYNCKVGLHLHDFKKDALAKAKMGLKHESTLMIDSCVNGLGRGLGNLKSEILFLELGKSYESLFDYSSKKYDNKKELLYALSANLDIHPDFVKDLLTTELNILESIQILKEIKFKTNRSNKRNYHKNMVSEISN